MLLHDQTPITADIRARLLQPGNHLGTLTNELAPRKWMPGSDTFSRTWRDQKDWPAETADATTFVQVAIVYRGREVTVLRDGREYARYTMPNPSRAFGPAAVVLFGQRHLDVLAGLAGVEVKALVSRSEARARELASRYGVGQTFPTIEEMLAQKGKPFAKVKHEAKALGSSGQQLSFIIDAGPKAKIKEIVFDGNTIK